MPNIDPHALFIRNPAIVASSIEDETVMMNLSTNSYYGLDELGSRVWKLFDSPSSLSKLCSVLMQEYEVSSVTCHEQIAVLLEELIEETLVCPIEAPT
ncbi:conserved hypothetical protein [Gammaproteobacteria bacterium]